MVAEALSFFHVVRGVEDGRSLVAQLLDGVKDVLTGLGGLRQLLAHPSVRSWAGGAWQSPY